ncbi:MAG: response regulator transcription factor [Candidatus Hydrogenedentes bacterium]|nr:response regulator transcription factor [Candidatus Hydrogenedentota bacterium]
MARETILVVDDEEDILELVNYNLTKAGFRVSCVSSGGEAVKAARTMSPDLVVLDLMLPGLDGLEVCTLLKNDPKTKDAAVIMLTARGEEGDVVRGLELGADDYVTKPFSPRILLARVQAVLRRREAEAVEKNTTIRVHGMVIHPGRHEVLVNGEPIELTFTEFRVLQCLARRPGWVFSRSQIVDSVRGAGYAVTDRAVDVQIVGLRKKLGDAGACIETVRGVGYRLKE